MLAMDEPNYLNAHSKTITLRLAGDADADSIAAVFSPSLRLLSFLPMLHTVDEERWWIANVILKECEVMVAEHNRSPVAFLARENEEIRLLHTHPDFIGQGAGALLLENAKTQSVTALELWCFQENALARSFYERHDFRAIRFTDGERNEEKTPDVRYRWKASVA